MRRWLQIVFAGVLIAALAILFIAPAYSIFPCALRAWNSSMTLLAALCTLIVFAFAAPMLAEQFLADGRRDHTGGPDRLRLTCSLLI